MNYYEPFRNYFEPLMNQECPKTDALVMSGFQQKEGGYIAYAKSCGMTVDYTKGLPKQGWHFIRAYLDQVDPLKSRIEKICCGELIFWMAEVSHALTNTELEDLANEVKAVGDRTTGNSLIKGKCFEKVFKIVMDEYSKVA